MITSRWTPLKDHPEQIRLCQSRARFKVVHAGRRSGKTEITGKRLMVLRAMTCHDISSPFYSEFIDPRFFIGAPTVSQVKRIYWSDIKKLIPDKFKVGKPNESTLTIHLVNGAELCLLGMDRPERAEGSPWDHCLLDEIGNMKPDTWSEHIRPALSDRRGGCDFVGVPEGRNHYYDITEKAKQKKAEAEALGEQSEWDVFWWPSEDILDEDEIISAREDLDELTYEQEYRGSFVNFSGRAYYPFDEKVHCHPLVYDPKGDLIFCYDFNTSPGVAVVCQEMLMPNTGVAGTGIIGEVYIEAASNTEIVTNRLINDWRYHLGRIFVYGDYTGGALKTSSLLGSDWEIAKRLLRQHFGTDRTFFRLKPNPPERVRVNSVNSRLMSTRGIVRMALDPSKAPKTKRDFEGVVVVKGGSGELDKISNKKYTHLTDAVGYYIWHEFPVTRTWEPLEKYWK